MMWPDLTASAARSGIHLPEASTIGSQLLFGRVGQRTLAVTSWLSVLDAMDAQARAANELAILSDIAQLRGLCEHMDSVGYVPATVQDLTNLEVPRRLIALTDLIQELCDRAVAIGIADKEGLRPTHFWHGAGRYLRIGRAGGWVGIEHRYWMRYGVGPLWVVFPETEFGRGRAVLDTVRNWTFSNPIRAYDADGPAAIPLRITPNATRDIVLDDLLAQLRDLHQLLRDMDAPAAVAPSPEDLE